MHDPLPICVFTGKHDNTPRQLHKLWPKLVELFLNHEERETKDGKLFSGVEYLRGQKRGLAGVGAVSLFVGDFDRGIAPEALTEHWERWEYVVYSTYSSTPEKPKWRVVFPLRSLVPAPEWAELYHALAVKVAQGYADPACRDASRMFYTPACPAGAPRFAFHHPGEWLDPLEFKPEVPALALPVRTAKPVALSNGHVSPETLIERALEKTGEGRNNAGLFLACQLRDNGFGYDDAIRCVEDYQQRVPAGDEPYTLDEALHSLDQAYNRAPRAAWEQPRPFPVEAKPPPPPDDLRGRTEAFLALFAQAKAEKRPSLLADESALKTLADIRRWDTPTWWDLEAELKNGRGRLPSLSAVLEKLNQIDPPAERSFGDRARFAGEMLDDCPAPQMAVPAPYTLLVDRTARVGTDEQGGISYTTIAFAPLLILGRARDVRSGQESLLLSWRWFQSTWMRKIVSRGVALQSRQIAELAAVGFPYMEESSRELASYLAKTEAVNRTRLPCARVTSHLGWQWPGGEAPFLCGHTLVLPDGRTEEASALSESDRPEGWSEDRILFHGVGEGEQQIVDAFHQAGNLAEWQQAIGMLRGFPLAMTQFYATFAAPLLQMFDLSNFIVDLSHSTTTGKTTTLRAAASVWGDPDERRPTSMLYTWDVTKVFFERASGVMNDLPVFLDDTKKARTPAAVADGIYSFVSGKGRGRGSVKGIAATVAFRGVLLTNGEQPAVSFTNDGGTRTRVLSLCGCPLGSQDLDADMLSKVLNERLCRHYGHAGPQFLSWLMKERENWPEWRALYQQWVDHYARAVNIPEAGRVAQYAAAVTVAGAMAHQAGLFDFAYRNPMVELWKDVAERCADAAGEVRALQDIISWSYSNEASFYGRSERTGFRDMPVGSISGRWDRDNWDFIAFYRTVLESALADLGYHPGAILKGWRDREWLDCDEGGFTKRVRLGVDMKPPTPRMVVLKRSAIESVEGSEDQL